MGIQINEIINAQKLSNRVNMLSCHCIKAVELSQHVKLSLYKSCRTLTYSKHLYTYLHAMRDTKRQGIFHSKRCCCHDVVKHTRWLLVDEILEVFHVGDIVRTCHTDIVSAIESRLQHL